MSHHNNHLVNHTSKKITKKGERVRERGGNNKVARGGKLAKRSIMRERGREREREREGGERVIRNQENTM